MLITSMHILLTPLVQSLRSLMRIELNTLPKMDSPDWNSVPLLTRMIIQVSYFNLMLAICRILTANMPISEWETYLADGQA